MQPFHCTVASEANGIMHHNQFGSALPLQPFLCAIAAIDCIGELLYSLVVEIGHKSRKIGDRRLKLYYSTTQASCLKLILHTVLIFHVQVNSAADNCQCADNCSENFPEAVWTFSLHFTGAAVDHETVHFVAVTIGAQPDRE